ncbi:TPR repeat-containing protein [Synechococcus sp. A18-25c]|uniref:tetratricopeptide repeat protein n=1 Tax=Synechococcus sp. A18-25c TaxID=1866938 RepID=UPI00164758E4|nr:tetratricopeptide repeat protein [Synechococcus sp. A18-25c]QNJ18465.1 TPR repeat-containing protein [Synechococcus sp. A18-25c]
MDLDNAECIFKQILAQNPKEPNALHLIGCIYKDLGQYELAAQMIQASIREDDRSPIPFLNLGKILVIVGQHENAISIFQESLKRNQGNAEAWFCIGNSLKQIMKLEESKQSYRNALQLDPSHVGAASNLGAILTNEGEFDQAEHLFLKALEHTPGDIIIRNNYGKLLFDKGQYDAAINQYQCALSYAPQYPELHYNLGNACVENRNFGKAIICYRRSIELKPDLADAYLNLGVVLNIEGSVDEAIINYRKVIELKPDLADAYLNLGGVLKDKGCVEEAIANYLKAIELNPDLADAYLNLGAVLKDKGCVEEAIVNYRKAIEVKPDFAVAKQALMLCLAENGIRESVSLEDYQACRALVEQAGILIAAYASFEQIPSSRRSINSWIEDKNAGYFQGQMFATVFVNLPWVKSKHFKEISGSLIPEPGDGYLDAVDACLSSVPTLQIRMSQAPVISSLVESVARRKGDLIDVIDVGGWSGNALFLSGFNDSWDAVNSWTVVETHAVCAPAREQLPRLLESLPEESGGKKNLVKLSFEELNSFYTASSASRKPDLIWSSTAQHYNANFPCDLDALLSFGADLVYLDTLPYLSSSCSALNVCEFTELRVADQMVSFLMSLKYLKELIAEAALKHGYSFKVWDQHIEPKLVFWQPQENDSSLPNIVQKDAKPLLMKVCSIRFDKLD